MASFSGAALGAEVVEVKNAWPVTPQGLTALLGQEVTLFCLNYIYSGRLAGVSDTCVLLEDAAIVYETGSFTDEKWKNAEKLPNRWYVQLSSIESFGKLK